MNTIENHKALLERELKELQEEIKRVRDVKMGIEYSIRYSKNEMLVIVADMQKNLDKVKKSLESVGC